LPVQLRRALGENGFRCGLVGPQLPESLRQLLDEQDDCLGIPRDDGKAIHGLLTPLQRLQSRAGRRNKIVASNSVRKRMVVLCREGGQVRGGTFEDAQCVFGLRTFPQGDGGVQLELIPEVQHGPLRQKWVGQEGMWRLDADRERKVFSQLRTEAVLSPGQTFLLTCTADGKGLGGQFFTEDASSGPVRKILLIRLAQTQLDELFAPEQISTPMATPAE
jgi:hypothetical protein